MGSLSTLFYVFVALATIVFGIAIILISFIQVRPIERAVVERFGKYIKTYDQGLHFLIPIVEKCYPVNITERMVDVEPQTVITKDKLNAVVDAVVYYKIQNVEDAIYNVDDHRAQLSSLARTTLRSVIGKMSLTEANENRDDINTKVEEVLAKETKSYGVDVLRVEIQKIQPPEDVQEAMNAVVKAENKKIASENLAAAAEIEADGSRRAAIKKAEGEKQAAILDAEGKANAIERVAEAEANRIKVVNESIREHFKGSAVDYKKLESAVEALKDNGKIIVGTETDIVNVISDTAGIVPIKEK